MTQKPDVDELRAEYDCSDGVRGKHHEAYREGTNVVLLDPAVAKAFPTPEAVNRALRLPIDLADEVMRRNRTKPSSGRG